MTNPFDQFDAGPSNPFDQFDETGQPVAAEPASAPKVPQPKAKPRQPVKIETGRVRGGPNRVPLDVGDREPVNTETSLIGQAYDALFGPSRGQQPDSNIVVDRAQRFALGAGEAVASAPESAAIAGEMLGRAGDEGRKKQLTQRERYRAELSERLKDPNLKPSQRGKIEQRIVQITDQMAELQADIDQLTPAKDRVVFKKGDDVRAWLTANIGTPDPERDQEFFGEVFGGLGNMVGMITVSAATGAVLGPAAAVTAGAGVGSSMNSSAVYREALDSEASDDEAFRAAGWASLVGSAEVVPIARIMRPLARISPQASKKLLERVGAVAVSAGEEAAQEAFNGVMNNMIAQGIYDPERGIWDDVGEQALVGLVTGGMVAGAVQGIDAARGRSTENQKTPIVTPEVKKEDDEEKQAVVEPEAPRAEPEADLPAEAPPEPAPAEDEAPRETPAPVGQNVSQETLAPKEEEAAPPAPKPDREVIPVMKPDPENPSEMIETGEFVQQNDQGKWVPVTVPDQATPAPPPSTAPGQATPRDVPKAENPASAQASETIDDKNARNSAKNQFQADQVNDAADAPTNPFDQFDQQAEPLVDQDAHPDPAVEPREPTDQDYRDAVTSILGTTEGGVENAREMLRDQQISNTEMAKKIAEAGWGGSFGSISAAPGGPFTGITGRGDTIEIRRANGETETLKPSQWLKILRDQFREEDAGEPAGGGDPVASTVPAEEAQEVSEGPQPNENGVYSRDDVVPDDRSEWTKSGKKGDSRASMDLLEVKPGRWASNIDFEIKGFQGGGGPLIDPGQDVTRDDAIRNAVARLERSIADVAEGKAGSAPSSAVKDAKDMLEWARSLLPDGDQPASQEVETTPDPAGRPDAPASGLPQERAGETGNSPALTIKDMGLTVTESVPDHLTEFAEEAIEGLIDTDNVQIVVAMYDDLAKGIPGFKYTTPTETKKAFRTGHGVTTGHMMTQGYGLEDAGKQQVLIGLRPTSKVSRSIETLAHEIGHAVEFTTYESASQETKDAIQKQFEERRTRGTMRQFGEDRFLDRRNRREERQARADGVPDNAKVTVEDRGDIEFNEWFADQVARHLFVSRPAQDVVDRFFQRISLLWKRLGDYLRSVGYSSGAVSDWLRAIEPWQPITGGADVDETGRSDGDAGAEPEEVRSTPQGQDGGDGRGASDQGSDADGDGGQVQGSEPSQDAGRGSSPASDRQRDRRLTQNFVIEPGEYAPVGGQKARAEASMSALRTLKIIEEEGRLASPEEKAILARYGGGGTLKYAMPGSDGNVTKGYERLAEELKQITTDAEYRSIAKTTQYAFYTSEPVMRAMWRAVQRLGFDGGKIYEPGMGIGGFPGTMPGVLRRSSTYQGSEIDPITARIAKQLYPAHTIQEADLTRTPLARDAFDLVIGNPPFADVAIGSDPDYPQKFLLHDYFFAKGLDAVRPGGLLAFVSSAGTMNKVDAKAREYLAERADLVGAIRLPSSAFKDFAGTEVTTDIIFLRKRMPGEEAKPATWTGVDAIDLPDRDGNTVKGNVNRYFLENPDMILGEQGMFDKLISGPRYGVRPREGQDLEYDLTTAIANLGSDVLVGRTAETDAAEVDAASQERKAGTFYLKDRKLYQFDGRQGKPVERRGAGVKGGKSAADMERIEGLIQIRDTLRDVYAADMAERDAKAERKALNRAYDAFVAKYGPINKAKITYRRPTAIEMERLRQEAREAARSMSLEFDEGTFDAARMLEDGASLREVAAARAEAAKLEGYNDGDFNPDDVPDKVTEKLVNVAPFMDDPESYRLRAIEDYDEKTGKASKTRVFTESTITRAQAPDINSPEDALLWALNISGRIDLDQIASLSNSDAQTVKRELAGSIFMNPQTGEYETASRYLSGNVRQKLEAAQAAQSSNPDMAENVAALEGVQPEPIPPAQIVARPGANWIPAEVYAEFAADLDMSLEVEFNRTLGRWSVTGDLHSETAQTEWGTSKLPFGKLMDFIMNRRPIRITKKVDGNDTLDAEATQAAQDMAAKINERFGSWLWEEQGRAEELAEIYNIRFNSEVAPSYDGSYLTTPGVSSDWSWRPHQRAVIARILQEGSTYMAHTVGAGKTSAMIGAGMEAKRLGLVKKPMYAVPNHMIAQFTKEFYEQYPLAKIRVADERNFHTDRRRQFIADVAASDLDAVIITHTGFGFIPVSDAFNKELVDQQVDEISAAITTAKAERGDRVTVSRLENMKEKVEQRLESRKKRGQDQVFTFEEMGVDMLFIDEAHLFRKLDFVTQMGNVKGVSPEGSQMAWDLYVKTRYLEKINPGRGLVLASGTPITNTMAELFTVSRYIQSAELDAKGVETFDAWAQTFGQTATALEQTPSGGYKEVTRFAEFINTAELSLMVRQKMDVVTSKDLEQYVTRPRLAGGKRQLQVVEPSPELKAFQEKLAERMVAIEQRGGPPAPGDDILLSVINDGRLAAIDMRLVDPDVQADTASKLEEMIANIAEIYHDTKEQPFYKVAEGGGYEAEPFTTGPATQMVFSTLGVNPSQHNPGFSVHRHIVNGLVARGVPRSDIANLSDAKNAVARYRLFNDMNEGKKRILIGSKNMFTGVNAQRRLAAIHNLDPLWFPADDEQRNGRGVRQGNMNREIGIYDYSTKGTYDATMWQMMGTKARFIEAFFDGDPSVRKMDDLGEASQYEQAKAMSTADPRILELTEMKGERGMLERRRDGIVRERYATQQRAKSAKQSAGFWAEEAKKWQELVPRQADLSGDKFKMTVADVEYTGRKEAGEAVIREVRKALDAETRIEDVKIGEVAGFDVNLSVVRSIGEYTPEISIDYGNGLEASVTVSDTPVGMARRLEGPVSSIDTAAQRAAIQRDAYAEKAKQAEAALDRLPEFTQQDELDRLNAGIKEIEDQLLAESGVKRDAPKEDADPDITGLSENPTGFIDPSRRGQSMTSAPFLPDRANWEHIERANGIWGRVRAGSEAVSDLVDKARQKIQDRFLPVLRAQKVLEAHGQEINEDADAYLTEEMYSGRAGYKLDRIDRDFTTPILEKIAASKTLSVEQVGEYLYARHAQERNAVIASINPDMEDGGSGMSNAEAEMILERVAQSADAETYKEIGRMVDDLRAETLKQRRDAGLISDKQHDEWDSQYKHYVPLKGFADSDFSDGYLDLAGVGRGYGARGKETKQALGRRSEAYNPLIGALVQAQEVAIRSEKNRVGQALHKLASEHSSKNLWTVKKPKMRKYFNASTGLVDYMAENPLSLFMADNEMAVKIDGEEHRIVFHDQRLARAAGTMGADQMGFGLQMLSAATRFLSMTNTMLDPNFIVRNAFRDAVTAGFNLGSEFKDQKGLIREVAANYGRALRGSYGGLEGARDTEWQKWFDEYSRVGGKVSFFKLDQPEETMRLMKKRVDLIAGSPLMRASKWIRITPENNPILGFIERANLAVDNAVRLSTYAALRKRGYSEQRAASIAKNLTVNFNRRGEYGSALNAWFMFFNANVQSTQVIFRVLSGRRGRQAAAGLVAIGFLTHMLNAAISEEDEEGTLAYDNIPEFKKAMNLTFMAGPNSEDALTVPLPYGYNVFVYLGDQLAKMSRGKTTGSDAFKNLAGSALTSFFPIGGHTLTHAITPTVFKPAYEIGANHDWLGRPIVSPFKLAAPGPDFAKFGPGATDASIAIAKTMSDLTGGDEAMPGLIDVSPEHLDHIASAATGGMGRFVGGLVDVTIKGAMGEFDEFESRDIPLAKIVYSPSGAWMDRSRYYDRRQEHREAKAAVKRYEKAGEKPPRDLAWFAAVLDEPLRDAERTLRKMRSQLRAMGGRRELSKAQREKYDKIEAAAMLKFNRAYVQAIRKMEKAGLR
ncbi:MAG: LPD38 domain-containing protein [Pseudomonadota bacterium]